MMITQAFLLSLFSPSLFNIPLPSREEIFSTMEKGGKGQLSLGKCSSWEFVKKIIFSVDKAFFGVVVTFLSRNEEEIWYSLKREGLAMGNGWSSLYLLESVVK